MMAAEESRFLVLVPFDPREGISLAVAAKRAGKSEKTIRDWCLKHGLGRRVGGGTWVVSQVALAMFLEGDNLALMSYLVGDRESSAVRSYFERFGLTPRKVDMTRLQRQDE
jgi:hypothetical protein